MLDVFEVARLLATNAVNSYGADIDLIGYYGSHAQGVAAAGSDFDLFYIPADGKQPPLAL